jgi:hypothetical protein
VYLNLSPFFVIWGLLAIAVLVLLGMRKSVASHEDDSIHVLGADVAPQQLAIAHKLDVIDKWGKTLTVVTVAFGLLLAAVFVIQQWVQAIHTVPTGA